MSFGYKTLLVLTPTAILVDYYKPTLRLVEWLSTQPEAKFANGAHWTLFWWDVVSSLLF